MALTKPDREDIQEMLDRAVKSMYDLSNAKMTGIVNVIDIKLDAIITQTTKTNGTVIAHTKQINDLLVKQGTLEEDVIYKYNHSIEQCPQSKIITELNENMLASKGFWKRMTWLVGIVVGLGGLFFTIINFLKP
jgi:hypothetical protein